MKSPSSRHIVHIAFESWRDFKSDLIAKLLAAIKETALVEPDVSKMRFVFRGLPSEKYQLRTAFDRYIDRFAPSDRVKLYDDVLHHFKMLGIEGGLLSDRDSIAAMYEDLPEDYRVAAVAQHRGLPTRLLDWSASPYVAAYFAAREARDHPGDYFVVWCLEATEASTAFEKEQFKILDQRVPKNFRQIWQVGVFTQYPHAIRSVEEMIEAGKYWYREPKMPLLFKCMIKKDDVDQVLQDLTLMRISSLSLFPGYDGLVGEVKEKLLQLLSKSTTAGASSFSAALQACLPANEHRLDGI